MPLAARPRGEVDDAVHHRQQRVDLVRGDQHGDPLLAGDPREQRDDLVGAAQVEVGQRLVEQQQPRAADQRVGDQDALLLAAGEPPDAGVGEAARVDRPEHLLDQRAARARGSRHPEPVRVQAEPDEIARPQRQVGVEQELLRDVADQRRCCRERGAPRDENLPALGGLQAEDHPEQRRLARAVGPDQPGELAGGDPEADPSRILRPDSRTSTPCTARMSSLTGAPAGSQLLRRDVLRDGLFQRLDLGEHPRLVVIAGGRHRLVDADHRNPVALAACRNDSVSESVTCWL